MRAAAAFGRRAVSAGRTARCLNRHITTTASTLLRRNPHHTSPPQNVLARSLFSFSGGNAKTSAPASALHELESSLIAQLPSSAPLSSSSLLPVVRQLLDVYMSQHKYDDAERLLWRLCDEQTRSGAASASVLAAASGEEKKASDVEEETVEAIRTMAHIVNVRRTAADAAHSSGSSGSSSTAAEISALDDLVDRHNTLTASASSGVVDHPANITFVANIARAYIDADDRSKAERVLRSALLFDESDSQQQQQGSSTQLEDGRRLRYATAYNFLGIAAYNPPEHVHSSACATHGHDHADDELGQYDWTESSKRWERSLALLTPFVARLASEQNAERRAALFVPDSVPLHLLRTYAMVEDNLTHAQHTAGKETEAVSTLQRSIATLSSMLPAHHVELVRVRHQLIALHLSSNNVAAAQKECEPILSTDHRLLSLELSPLLDHLAQSFFRLRHFQYAARLFQHCIALREAAVASPVVDGAEVDEATGTEAAGMTDLTTAARLNDLAMCELKLNNHAAAEDHLRRSIAIKDRVLGVDHWEGAVSVHNLGTALMGQRKYTEAEVELQRAKKLYQAKYAAQPNSSEKDREAAQAIVSSHLGQCYALMEQWTDSIVQYQAAIETKQRALGDHPSVAMDLTQLGGVLIQAGSYVDAVSAYERVRDMAQRMYGAEHTNVAVALHWLSVAEARAGRLSDAVSHAREAVAQGERMQAAGSMQRTTLDVMKNNLAEQMSAAGGEHATGAEQHAGSTNSQSRSQ